MARIVGGPGNESLTGTAGDDTIEGGDGNDTLNGLGGHDFLDGGAGVDRLIGGSGNDTFAVTSGDVLRDSGGIELVLASASWVLASGFENLTLTGAAIQGLGNAGDNVIRGNSSNNVISGRAGDDTLFGMDGDDVFNMSMGAAASSGNDFIHGGAGVDTLDFGANARSAVFVDLGAGTASGGGSGGAGSATLRSIENAVGGNFADRLVGSNARNFLYGGAGDDTLDGGAGADRLEGAGGNDTYIVTAGDVLVDSAGVDLVISREAWTLGAGLENLVLDSTGFQTSGTGNNLANVLDGRSSHSVMLYGRGGNDTLYGAGGTVTGNLQGYGYDRLSGGDGNDELHGAGAQDELTGGAGDDLAFGDEDADTFYDGAGNDTMFGGTGDDLFVMLNETADYGDNAIDGGDGIDSVFFHGFRGQSAVVVDLAAGRATGGGPSGSGSATLVSIERVFGTQRADHIEGDDRANWLHGQDGDDFLDGAGGDDRMEGETGNDVLEAGGGNDEVLGGAGSDRAYGGDGRDTLMGDAGNDSLWGEGGDDHLQGGAGSDRLNGGAGNDTLRGGPASELGEDGVDFFVFAAAPGAANADVIRDFGGDKIALVASWHANIGARGNFAAGDARFYAAPGATSGHDRTDRVIFDTEGGRLYYDADGSDPGTSQLLAIFEWIPNLQASDITIL